MTFFPHAFEAPLVRHGIGRERQLHYTVLFLPDELAAILPFDRYPQLRVEGEVADLPYSGAFLSAGGGLRYCMISPGLCREAGLTVGDPVSMRFAVADQAAVDIPDALSVALNGDAEAKVAWGGLTPGKRRALAHFVGSAKQRETVERRVVAAICGVTGRTPPPDASADLARLRRVLG